MKHPKYHISIHVLVSLLLISAILLHTTGCNIPDSDPLTTLYPSSEADGTTEEHTVTQIPAQTTDGQTTDDCCADTTGEDVLPSESASAPSEEVTSVETTTDHAETTAEEESTSAENIVRAPDFTVYDRNGTEVRLSDYFGKPIVLNFWASWCAPCRAEMPEFEEVFREYGDTVQFLMVNLTFTSGESIESVSQFASTSGYTFPILFDMSSEAATAYGVSSIPTTYFIDEHGTIKAYANMSLSKELLLSGIEMIR